MGNSGLYIHIPFCKSKCIYCDFFSGSAKTADWKGLVVGLLNELMERRDELKSIPDTLYIGGGTPSLMPAECFMNLINGVVEITGDRWREFTIEVNPDDVTERMCEIWKGCGVSRVSMGVQSFNNSELKGICRRHDAECAENAYRILRRYFDNISLDLMFGLPGQSVESWNESVEKAIALNPDHLSAYSLMFEEGTPLTVLREQDRISLPGDEECVEMWKLLSERIRAAGYERYEISNYSKPGRVSVHNSRYWLGVPYLGIGPSAHSYDGERIRRSNPADLKGYLRRFAERKGGEPFYEGERLSDEELSEEMILTRMRIREGLNLMEYGKRFGSESLSRLKKNAHDFMESGMIICRNDHLIISDNGIMKSDDIIVALSI